MVVSMEWSSMMASTENYTAVATQARQVTERSVDAFRTGARTFTDQLDQFKLPTVDLTEPVARYFEYVQKAVDLNRDLAIRWAELVTALSGSVQEQAERVTDLVQDQTDTVADLAVEQVERAERSAKEQADMVERSRREQEEHIEEAAREQARQARAEERAKAQQSYQEAREAYEGLTKAELADRLAERGLPKTGNVEELIERLLSSDSK
jgi:uncharacterized protein with von Willebrand factor type A (vWA) domain